MFCASVTHDNSGMVPAAETPDTDEIDSRFGALRIKGRRETRQLSDDAGVQQSCQNAIEASPRPYQKPKDLEAAPYVLKGYALQSVFRYSVTRDLNVVGEVTAGNRILSFRI
ncbi:hypothetical protein Trydic_g6037 [Trypoxylus dichotomus]